MSGITSEQRGTNVNLVTTAETVALTIPFSGGCAANVSLAAPPGVGGMCQLRISAMGSYTPGVAATAIQVRVRRGGLTGSQVGATLTIPAAAAAADGFTIEVRDGIPGFAQAYSITVQQVAATGNGTVNDIVGTTQDYN